MTGDRTSARIDKDFLGRAISGRCPVAGDDPQPWTYSGHLLWYVQLAHCAHPAVPDRWGYLAECFVEEKLPDDPIPRMEFGHPSPDGRKMLRDWMELVAERHGRGWSCLRLLVEWMVFALGMAPEPPPELDEADHERLYRGLDLGPWLLNPSDYLGEAMAERAGSGKWNPHGFFPTPHSVVECMVQMTMADAPEDARRLTVNDPCLGTGRMLLHASNYSLRLSGVDIDRMVLDAALVNFALYAPWAVAPIPWLDADGDGCDGKPQQLPAPADAQPQDVSATTETTATATGTRQMKLFG